MLAVRLGLSPKAGSAPAPDFDAAAIRDVIANITSHARAHGYAVPYAVYHGESIGDPLALSRALGYAIAVGFTVTGSICVPGERNHVAITCPACERLAKYDAFRISDSYDAADCVALAAAFVKSISEPESSTESSTESDAESDAEFITNAIAQTFIDANGVPVTFPRTF